MKITFKPNDKEKFYVDDTRVTNGHWLLNKETIKNNSLLKKLKIWNVALNGSYYYKEFQNNHVPKLDAIIPDIKLGYYKLDSFSLSAPKIDVDTFEIQVIELDGSYKDSENEVKRIKIGVSPDYVALLSLGEVWIKDKLSPIAIVNNEEAIGVVMPMRI